jgi:hypothetical protein
MRRALYVLAVLAIALAVGCSHIEIRDKGETRRQEHQKYLDSLVGQLSIDEALAKWGPPTSSTEGDNVIAYAWKTNQYAGSTGFTSGNASSFGGYSTGSSWTFMSPEYHGYEMGMIFDKATRLLKSSIYREW